MGRKFFKRGIPCWVKDCERLSVSLGLCRTHYYRCRTHGDPLLGQPTKGARAAWIRDNAGHKGDECLFWPHTSPGVRSTLQFRGRKMSASRAMCLEVWGEPPTPDHESAHSCGNGHLDCLNPQHIRWATRSENAADKLQHGTHNRGSRNYCARLREEDVLRIRELIGTRMQKDVAQIYGVSKTTICQIATGRTWGWL